MAACSLPSPQAVTKPACSGSALCSRNGLRSRHCTVFLVENTPKLRLYSRQGQLAIGAGHRRGGRLQSTHFLQLRASLQVNNSNNTPSKEDGVASSDGKRVAMVPLEKPPTASSRFDTDRDSVGDPGSQRPNLLQRIALSFFKVFTALLPARLKGSTFRGSFSLRMVRLAVFCGLGALLSVLGHFGGGHRLVNRSSSPQEVVYSDFLRLVDTGNVRSARFEEGTGRILFDITPHSAASHEAAKYTAHGLPQVSGSGSAEVYAMVSRNRSRSPLYLYTRHLPDPQLISRLLAAGVEFGTLRASVTSSLTRILATALALWIPLIPMFIIMRRFLDGRSGGAKRSRNKSDKNADVPLITFDDVAGVGAAKAELQEVVACLKDPRIFARLGAKLPSGVLLCGPPGTGKTLLAKAVAGEAGVPFLAVSASEFVELFVGRGAARVRELFAEARKRAPCVVFIDELDAVGGRRGAGLNEERDQTLNQLLTELDGFDGRPGVVLLAATNRPDVLDQALLRPGRLSRRVTVPLPDEVGRAAILSVHLRAVKLEGGDEATPQAAALLARITPGFSGADLANLCNEAAFLGIRRGAESVSLEDLITAVNRQRFGVNGGEGSGSNNLISWAQKLQGWLIDASSSAESTRSSPLGS